MLLEKRELQHQRNSILISFFGLSARWGFEKYMFQQLNFPNNVSFSDFGESKRAKETASKGLKTKFNNCSHIQLYFLTDI